MYVTGYSTGSGTGHDYATIKYDADGNQLWAARYSGPGNFADGASALALDAAGNVYVTGIVGTVRLGSVNDYATIKYDLDGNEIWVARYDGPVNGNDVARTLAVDAGGNVYVTGESKQVTEVTA